MTGREGVAADVAAVAEAIGRAIEAAWNGSSSDELPNLLPPIDLSDRECRHLGSAALAVLDEPRSDWRGIESAPKDGTPFLAGLWVRTNDAEPEWEQYVVWCNDETGEIASGCDFGWEIADIEGWMPLPPAPAAEASDNKENTRG